jgi:hypothetical protein
VAQGKSLEQEVSTRRPSRSDHSTRPAERLASLRRVPTGDANVNGFLAGRNIGEAQGFATAKAIRLSRTFHPCRRPRHRTPEIASMKPGSGSPFFRSVPLGNPRRGTETRTSSDVRASPARDEDALGQAAWPFMIPGLRFKCYSTPACRPSSVSSRCDSCPQTGS